MTSCRYPALVLYRRLLSHARPYQLHIVGILLLGLLSTPLALLTPLPLKIAIDSVIGSEPIPGYLTMVLPDFAREHTLLLAAMMVVAIGLLVYIQSLAVWLLQTYTGEKLVLGFRSTLFRHVQRLSLSYHDARGTSDSAYRIQYDASSIQSILVNGIAPFISSIFTVIGMIYVTVRIDWKLGTVALMVSPVLFALARASRKRLRNRWHAVKNLESSAMSVVQETLAALRVVKAFGQEEREQNRYVRKAGQTLKGEMDLALIEGGFDLLVGLTIAAGTASVLYLGILHVQSGILTLGDLIIVTTYIAQLFSPLESLTKRAAQLQSALAGAERVFALLDETPEVIESRHPKPVARSEGAVTFEHVSFAYEKDQMVLHGISFDVNPGARIGIVGTTGAGKTTLINLLTRFYDPTTGRILLDGTDSRDYKLADLRNQFAIVLQEPVLFSTSIAENIAYGRSGAGEDEIIQAAQAANAHNFILNLPEGYATVVGERGMRLSGGERQRIALARAFLKDAPILILDEPTSSVDIRTEDAILEDMDRLMIGRTTFIITHRPSALKYCDLILKIEGGCLVEILPGECQSQPIPAGPERDSRSIEIISLQPALGVDE